MCENQPPEHMSSLASRLEKKLDLDRARILDITTKQLNKLGHDLLMQTENALDTTHGAIIKRQGEFHHQLDGIQNKAEESIAKARKTIYWAWLMPILIGLFLFCGTSSVIWSLTQYQRARYQSSQESLIKLQESIAVQEQTLKILTQKTWGLQFMENEKGRWIILPKNWTATTNWVLDGHEAIRLQRR